MGVWNIATQGTDGSNYDVVLDFETMDDGVMEKLIRYIESVSEKEKQREK